MRRLAVPVSAGIVLAFVLAAAGFCVQSVLPAPTTANLLGTQLLQSLQHTDEVGGVERLRHKTQVKTSCISLKQEDVLRIGGQAFVVDYRRRHTRVSGLGSKTNHFTGAEADLAACPDVIKSELADRLMSPLGLHLAPIIWRHLKAYRVRMHVDPPFVSLVVTRRGLKPLAVVYTGAHVRGSSLIRVDFARASTARATNQIFLQLAVRGLAAARRAWWNPHLHWYDDHLGPKTFSEAPAYLWSAFPLFEAYDALALAAPMPANKQHVASFAAGAEQYWNGLLRPTGGYAYLPGKRGPHLRTYFDDNGWWAIAFADAYRATGDRRYLTDAARALTFILSQGWDRRGGGIWWDTGHGHTTSEPLGAAAYTAAVIYAATHDPRYLADATHLVGWADKNLLDPKTHLYGRNPTDHTTMDYVQGMMIGAKLELCKAAALTSQCRQAEEIGAASMRTFPTGLSWSPTADGLYLRFLLALYRYDHQTRWRDRVIQETKRALVNAPTEDGLYLKGWNGAVVPGGLLRTDAGTVALFAWLAANAAGRG